MAKHAKSKKLLDAAAMCEALNPEKEAIIRDVLSRVTDKWSLWALSEVTAVRSSPVFAVVGAGGRSQPEVSNRNAPWP